VGGRDRNGIGSLFDLFGHFLDLFGLLGVTLFSKPPPHFEPQKTKDTPPFWTPLYIYIYTEGLFGGRVLGFSRGVFDTFRRGFLDGWALPVAWLLIPDFRHAHTLQQPKRGSRTLTPGRVFREPYREIQYNMTRQTIQRHKNNIR